MATKILGLKLFETIKFLSSVKSLEDHLPPTGLLSTVQVERSDLSVTSGSVSGEPGSDSELSSG